MAHKTHSGQMFTVDKFSAILRCMFNVQLIQNFLFLWKIKMFKKKQRINFVKDDSYAFRLTLGACINKNQNRYSNLVDQIVFFHSNRMFKWQQMDHYLWIYTVCLERWLLLCRLIRRFLSTFSFTFYLVRWKCFFHLSHCDDRFC